MAQGTSLDRFSELIDAAAGVVGETDLEQVLRRLVTEARTATGARYAALGVLGEHGVLSEFLYEGISDEEAARIGNLPTGKGVLGAVIRENRTIRLDVIGSHSDTSGFPPHHPSMTTFLGVPVSVGEAAFGNLYLTEKPGGFSDDDVILVEALSKIAGAAVRTARLQDRLRRVAIVEDRQRIARDLHDSVIQDLFAVGLGLQGVSQIVDDNRAAATIVEAVDRLDEAVETLRSYIFDLRQIVESRPALEDRLTDLVARMSSAYPAEVTLEMSAPSEGDGSLDDDLVKMVTEGLSNALRHASARHVHVEVGMTADGWVLVVRDDGVGFDPEVDHGGMGLDNLRARVERHGGRVSVDTRPGAGTTLTMTMPLP